MDILKRNKYGKLTPFLFFHFLTKEIDNRIKEKEKQTISKQLEE